MSDVILSRRRFLIGSAAAALSVSSAKLLKAAPILKPVTDFSHRSGYEFDVLPSWQEVMGKVPKSKLAPVDVTIWRSAPRLAVQIESGHFPTSFIPTDAECRTRDADNVIVSTEPMAHDFTRPLSFGGHITNTRASPSYVVHNGKLLRFEPGQSRIIPDEGLLVEEERTNLVTYTNPDGVGDAYDWTSQVVSLKPGRYVLTWYGDGTVSISGERVWMTRRERVQSVSYMSRALSDEEIDGLTE